jgi:hypothetical protein
MHQEKGGDWEDYHLKQIQGELLRLINFEHIITWWTYTSEFPHSLNLEIALKWKINMIFSSMHKFIIDSKTKLHLCWGSATFQVSQTWNEIGYTWKHMINEA